MPRIVEPTEATIHEAAERLRAGGVIAFPTETVYGLGCDTFNISAIERVFDLKGRPFDNPLIAHVKDLVQVSERLAVGWDARCDALAAHFWPGPLTLVVHKRSDVPLRATAGRDTIAIRCPDHPVARDLLARFGGPISAPSANRSGHVSPTIAQHIAEEFAEVEDLMILDGGPCRIGIESTVLEMTANPPRILRPGSISADQIGAIIGAVIAEPIYAQDAGPGTSMGHYAPQTPARLLSPHDLRNEIMALRGRRCAVLAMPPLANSLRGRKGIFIVRMAEDPAEFARSLYGSLREADSAGVDVILIESPPDESPWHAVLDRLRRATSGGSA